MSSNKAMAILTADTHLRDRTWVDRRALVGDAYYSFQQLVDTAVERRLPIIAAGDLIDKRRNESDVPNFLRGQFDRMAEADVPFYFIQGQHELQDTPWLWAIHSHPVWLDAPKGGRSVEIGGRKVVGLDWRPADQLEAALATVPEDTDLLVMHQVCQDFMGGVTACELRFSQLPHATTVLIGDYHVHTNMLATGAQGQIVRVLSPGSTCMQSIAEDNTKGYYLMYGDMSCASQQLKTRPFFAADLCSDNELDDFIARWPALKQELADWAESQQLPAALRMPILDVRYAEELSDAYRRLTRAIGDDAHLFTAKVPKEETAEEAEMAYLMQTDEGGPSLVGCLQSVVDPEEQRELYSATRTLLESPNPREELARMRVAFGL